MPRGKPKYWPALLWPSFLPKRVSKWQFTKDLYYEIGEDQVFNGAAALAYYFFLAIFPAMIFLLSLLPYLPIHNLHTALLDFINQILPSQASKTFEGVIDEVTQKRAGLLSIGALLTLWTASSGIYAIMQQLNVTYDVTETRPYWKARGLAVVLTVAFCICIPIAFTLIVFGGYGQTWLQDHFALGQTWMVVFGVFRWLIIGVTLGAGFAALYYMGPDVEQRFRFITPGSILAVVGMTIATIGFREYAENFSNYTATYGSIGAVIILMLWLYIVGVVIIIGSEVNALAEHYAPNGKNKGERTEPDSETRELRHYQNSRGTKRWSSVQPEPEVYARGRAPLPGRGIEPSRAERRQPLEDGRVQRPQPEPVAPQSGLQASLDALGLKRAAAKVGEEKFGTPAPDTRPAPQPSP